MLKMTPISLALTLVATLTGCAIGPDYVKPSVETPAAFKEAPSNWKLAEPQDLAPRGQWWQVFGDPVLNGLLEQVEVSNQNIKQAEAQYRQAEALVQGARSSLFPSVGSDVSAARSGSSAGVGNKFNLNLNASWEPDIWGKIRRTVEANQSGAEASAADLAAAKLSAQASVAQNYFQLRVADLQRELFQRTVEGYQKSLQMSRNKYAVGVVGRSDVAQAETQLKATQAQAVDLELQRAQLEHAIAVLIGKAPANFSLPAAPFAVKLPAIPGALPSRLLERRPDIAAAERRAAAANAQIGVAKAAYFPDLTLSASGGFVASSFAHWLSVPNRIWSLGPALVATLFDGGLRASKTKQAEAGYDATVANYRQTVLAAFQEVEDNLAALRILEQEAALQDAAVASAQESERLALNQYQAGTVDYLQVVSAQTAALSNQRSAAQLSARQLAASVLLVKALGGGWNAPE
jgi:NodT family efflux transporter outer membrane factor (OMF) lipoprotein